MTRNECEKLIAEKLNEIREIHRKYNPHGNYLHMTVTDEYVSGCNEYYLEDREHPIDFRQYNGEPIMSRKHEGDAENV